MSDITEITASTANHIVVIDDDPGVRALLQDCLELDGFVVRPAANGADGLDLLMNRQPSCVVLDVMMPQLNGHSVLRLLRERHGFNLPVIMLTAASDDDQAWQAWSGGVDCFMAKPFDMGDLLHRVRALCGPAAAASSGVAAAGRPDTPGSGPPAAGAVAVAVAPTEEAAAGAHRDGEAMAEAGW